MKNTFFLLLVALCVVLSGIPAIAGSCDDCPSKTVCDDAKAGSECASGDHAGHDHSKHESANAAETKGTSEVALNAKAISMHVSSSAKNFIVKLKGEKAQIDKLIGDFSAKFSIKEKKGPDCEIVSVASEIWIKIKAGAEKDKLDYLKSLGIEVK